MHNRHTIRLKNHDYTQGAYFVTLCTHDGAVLFGDIVDGRMCLNDAGCMVNAVWRAMSDHSDGIDIDEFVIMPDHMHGIIIMNKGRAQGASNRAGTGARPYMYVGAAPCGGRTTPPVAAR